MADNASISFVLPFALESLNVRDRKHWSRRSKDKQSMSMEVLVAIGGPRYFPRPPWERVRITVVRCSAGRLDKDNLTASVKNLLDCLCLQSSRHPTGLNIIVDDSDSRLDLVMRQSDAAPGRGSTIVKIERLSNG